MYLSTSVSDLLTTAWLHLARLISLNLEKNLQRCQGVLLLFMKPRLSRFGSGSEETMSLKKSVCSVVENPRNPWQKDQKIANTMDFLVMCDITSEHGHLVVSFPINNGD